MQVCIPLPKAMAVKEVVDPTIVLVPLPQSPASSVSGKIDKMEKENAPPSSCPKLSLSLKRRFAALEKEDVEQYSLVKVPKCIKQSNNWAREQFRRVAKRLQWKEPRQRDL